MFDGQRDESPSVRGKPNSDSMDGCRNHHTAESKPSVVECFTHANGWGERMDVTQGVEPITRDQDLRLSDHGKILIKYA